MPIDINNLPIGTLITTHGDGRPLSHWPWSKSFWEELGKDLLYQQIRGYQKDLGYAKYDATHVRVAFYPGYFLEATLPRVTEPKPISDLAGKRVGICVPIKPFDVQLAIQWWRSWIGTHYDVAELADFALSRLLRAFPFKGRLGVLDRVDRFVCSTFASGGLNAGGFPFDMPWDSIPPAYYENKSQLFRVTYVTV